MGFDNFFEEVVEEFNYDEKKKELIDNLDTLKNMSVEEATLYKKWQEFNKGQDFHKFAYKFDVLEKKIRAKASKKKNVSLLKSKLKLNLLLK